MYFDWGSTWDDNFLKVRANDYGLLLGTFYMTNVFGEICLSLWKHKDVLSLKPPIYFIKINITVNFKSSNTISLACTQLISMHGISSIFSPFSPLSCVWIFEVDRTLTYNENTILAMLKARQILFIILYTFVKCGCK